MDTEATYLKVGRAWASGGAWVYVYKLSHRCCLLEGELKQPETKRAELLQPSLRVCTFTQGEEMLLSLRYS
jgi:hypothetical protein